MRGETWETRGKSPMWAGIEQEREAVTVAGYDCLLDIAQSAREFGLQDTKDTIFTGEEEMGAEA